MEQLKPQTIRKMLLSKFIDFARSHGATAREAKEHFDNTRHDEVFSNDIYLVIRRDIPNDMNPMGYPNIKWISIRRIDGQPLRNWEEIQQIKNEMLGMLGEAIEVFPNEEDKVNTVNQYHLFGGPDWKAPFGFPSSTRSNL